MLRNPLDLVHLNHYDQAQAKSDIWRNSAVYALKFSVVKGLTHQATDDLTGKAAATVKLVKLWSSRFLTKFHYVILRFACACQKSLVFRR